MTNPFKFLYLALLLILSNIVWASSEEVGVYNKIVAFSDSKVLPQADTLSFPALTEEQKLIGGNPTNGLIPSCPVLGAATGGTGNLTYVLELAIEGGYTTNLPGGGSFNQSSLQFCTSSSIPEDIYNLRLTATDELNATATQTYYLRSLQIASFISSTLPTDITYKRNQPFSFNIPVVANPHADYPLGFNLTTLRIGKGDGYNTVTDPASLGLPEEGFNSDPVVSNYEYFTNNATFSGRLSEADQYRFAFFGFLAGAEYSSFHYWYVTIEENTSYPVFSAIEDLEVIEGFESTTLTLANASEGNGTLVYTLLLANGSSLPDGMTFNPATLELVVDSTALLDQSYTLSYAVTDDLDQEVIETFTLSVANNPISFVPGVNDNIFINDISKEIFLQTGSQITDLKLFSINPLEPGDFPYTYSLVNAQSVAGLAINSSTGVLSGTVSANFVKTAVQVKVVDATNDSALSSAVFFTPGALASAFANSDNVEDLYCTTGFCNIQLTLPALSTQGNVLHNYILTLANGSALPEGLSFNELSRVLSTDANTAIGDYDLKYTGTDIDGDFDIMTFTVSVSENTEISLEETVFYQGGEGGNKIEVEPGTMLDSFVFFKPTALLPGNAPLTYSLAFGTENDISIDSSTGGLSLDVPADLNRQLGFRVLVTDNDGDTYSSTVRSFIPGARTPELSSYIERVYCFFDNESCSFVLSGLAVEGNVFDTFTLTRTDGIDLPSRIAFSASDRTLSVNSSDLTESTTYELLYRVEDADGSFDENVFNLTLSAYVAPFLTELEDISIIQGQALDYIFPEPGLGFGVLDYSLTLSDGNALPSGYSFDDSTRVLSVNSTSLVAGDSIELRYKITDSFDNSDEKDFSFSILEDFEISQQLSDFFDGSNEIALEPGKQITNAELYTIREDKPGNPPLEYTLIGALDLGLTINASSGRLSGLVTTYFGNVPFQINVTDADGDSHTSFERFFVSEAKAPSFAEDSIALFCPDNGLICELTLEPVSKLGNINNKYALDWVYGSSLPTELTFDPSNSLLTLDTQNLAENVNYELIFSATDVDGDVANQSIDLSVVAYEEPVSAPADDSSIIQGQTQSYIFPKALSGFGKLGYAITHANGSELSASFSFNSNTRNLTVNSSALSVGDLELSYVVSDTYDGNGTVDFTFTIQEDFPIALEFGDIYIDGNEIALASSKQIENVEFFRVSADSPGNLPLDYTLVSGSELGLSINSTTGLISGTVIASFDKTEFRIRVTDADGDTRISGFRYFIQEGRTPTFSSEPEDVSCPFSESSCSFTIPSIGIEGNAHDDVTVTFENGSELPSYLVFSESNSTLRVVPNALSELTTLTLKNRVEDIDGSFDEDTFSLTIGPYSAPVLEVLYNQSIIKGQSNSYVFPIPSLSFGDLNYSMQFSNGTELTSGFTFNSDARNLSINAETLIVGQAYDLSYQVTDSYGSVSSSNFTMTVLNDYVVQLERGDFYVNDNNEVALEPSKQITDVEFYRVSAANPGNPPLTFTLLGATGLGLSIDSSTGLISGTLPAGFGKQSFRVRVVDADSESHTSSIRYFVPESRTPVFEQSSLSFLCSTLIANCEQSLDSISNLGNIYDNYDLTLIDGSDLPDEVSYNASNFSVSVDTDSLTENTIYELLYTATDADGSQGNQSINITVNFHVPPVVESFDDFSVIEGQTLNFTLPSATSSFGPLSYEVQLTNGSILPVGLSFINASRILTVNSSAYNVGDELDLSYIISDSFDGNTTVSFKVSIIENFLISQVLGDFYVNDDDEIALEPGKQINDIEIYKISTVKPGNPPLTYTLDGADGLGLTIDESTGWLSGQLPTSFEKTTFRIRVTDTDGDTHITGFRHFIPEARNLTFTDSHHDYLCIDYYLVCEQTLDQVDSPGNVFDTYTLTLSNGSTLPAELTLITTNSTLEINTLDIANNTNYQLLYTSTDADGDTASQTINLTVSFYDEPVAAEIDPISIVKGQILSYVLPEAVYGIGDLTYELKTSNGSGLPTGLSFDQSTRTLQVDSSSIAAEEVFALDYSISDQYEANTTVNFTITVLEDIKVTLTLADFHVNDDYEIALEPGKQVSDIEIYKPSETHYGNLPLTFELIGATGLGLSINSSTGKLSGELPTTFSKTAFKVKVSDIDGDGVTSFERYFIPEARTPSFSDTNIDLQCNNSNQFCNLTLGTVSGDGNIYETYSLAWLYGSDLPDELSFNASSSILTLDTLGLTNNTNYQLTYSATDADGSVGNQSVNLTAVYYHAPISGTIDDDLSVVEGLTNSFVLPEAVYGLGTIKYSVTLLNGNALTSGISFNKNTRTLTVNSENLSPSVLALRYRTYDTFGGSVYDSFNVTIDEDVPVKLQAAEFYFESEDNIALEPGKEVTNLVVFEISPDFPGNPPLTFYLQGADTTNLTADPDTGFLSGILSPTFLKRQFRIKVTDVDEDAHYSGFRYFIPDARAPSFASQMESVNCTFGESSCSFTLPAQDSEGNFKDEIRLELQGGLDLPDSLSFTESTRSLVFNTADVPVDTTYNLVYSVTDVDGSNETQLFDLTLATYFEPVVSVINNFTIVEDQILDLILPEVELAFNAVSYAVTLSNGDALSSDMSFNSNNRTLTIDASNLAVGDEVTFSYIVTDSFDGDTAVNFTMSVLENIELKQVANDFYINGDNEIALEPGKQISNLQLFSIDTNFPGNLPLTYEFVSEYDIGLTIDAGTGALSGLVEETFSKSIVRIRATDVDGDTHISGFRYFIPEARTPNFVDQARDLSCLFGDLTCSYTLPAQLNLGNINDTITLQSEGGLDLPDSLSFDVSTRELVFDTDGLAVDTEYTLEYSIIDFDGSKETQVFNLILSNYFLPVLSSVDNISIIKGEIDNYILPQVEMGLGDITYEVAQSGGADLPVGISFNSSSRNLHLDTGSLSTGDQFNLTYTINDGYGLGDTVLNFVVSVIEDSQISLALGDFYANENNEVALEPGKQITDVEFYRISTDKPGNPPLTYSLIGAAGLGLSINTSTGTLSGELPSSFGKKSFRIRVVDADSEQHTSNNRYFIAESRTPAFADSSVDLICSNTVDVCLSTLDSVDTLGNIYDVYSVSLTNGSILPTELSFNASTLSLALDIENLLNNTNYQLTYTSTDADGSIGTQQINLTVIYSSVPVVPAVDNLTIVNGQTVNFVLPQATSLLGSLNYDVTLANGSSLSNGLSFIGSTRTLTVNTANFTDGEQLALTYIVSDNFNVSTEVDFSIRVEQDLIISQVLADFYVNDSKEIALEPGKIITDVQIYNIDPAKPGNKPYKYEIFDAAALGITIDASTGLLSGPLPEVFIKTPFRIKVTDVDKDSHTAGERYFVPEARTPAFDQVFADVYCRIGESDCSYTLPSKSVDGNVFDTITLQQANGSELPSSLVFDSSNGMLTVDSDSVTESTIYTLAYRIEDVDGSFDQQIFNVTIGPYITPSFAAISDLTIIQSVTKEFTLPATEFGFGELNYSIQFANGTDLTSEISFNVTSRVLNVDTSDVTQGTVYNFLYFAHDAFDASSNTSFSLTVIEDIPLIASISDFYINSADEIALEPGKSFNGLEFISIDADAAGNTPLTYSLEGAEGLGITINASTGLLSGQPPETFGKTIFRVKVTDANDDGQITAFRFFIPEARTPAFEESSVELFCSDNDLVCELTLDSVSSQGNIYDFYNLTLDDNSPLPAVLSFNSTSLVLTFLTEDIALNTNYPLLYTSTDIDGDIGNQSISLTLVSYGEPVAAPIADLSVIQGQIKDFNLPKAASGFGELTYSVSQADDSEFPSTLSFEGSNRTLTINSSSLVGGDSFALNYLITDSFNSTDSVNFTLNVITDFDIELIKGEIYVNTDNEIAIAPSKAINNVSIVDISANKPGNQPFTYTLIGATGLGLSIDSDTGLLSGTLPAIFSDTSFNIKATDADGDSHTSEQFVFVSEDRTPSFGTDSQDLNCPFGDIVCNYNLPLKSTEGNIHDTLSLVQANGSALPSYLSFNEANSSLMVDPDTITDITTFELTYHIEDVDGSFSDDNFTLTIGVYVTPSFGDITDKEIIQGESDSYILPEVLSSFGTLQYSIESTNGSDLPAGITFANTTRLLSVDTTDFTAGEIYSLTYLATDIYNATGNTTIKVTILEDLGISLELSNVYISAGSKIALEPGKQITDVEIYTPTEEKPGNLPLTYALLGANKLGFSINASTGYLSGDLPAVFSEENFQIRVTDVDGDAFNTAFRSFISEARAPAFAVNASSLICINNVQVCEFILDSVDTTGNIYENYSVVLANGSELPTELDFNTDSLILSLETQGIADNTSYQLLYTATDADGDTANHSISLTVSTYGAPVSAVLDDLDLVQSQTESFTLPEAVSGFGILTYSMSLSDTNPLSAGLSFEADNRTLTVDSTGLTANETIGLSYTITDSYGGSDVVNFTLNVLENLDIALEIVSFYTNEGKEVALEVGSQVTDAKFYQPTAAQPGNEPLSYSLIGAANVGLSINASTGLLSGTVASTFNKVSFQVKVTDRNGDDFTTGQYFFVEGTRAPAFASAEESVFCAFYELSCSYNLAEQTTNGNIKDTITLTLSNGNALPSYLVFDESNLTLTADATQLSEITTFELAYRIEDKDTSFEENIFNVTIGPYFSPTFIDIDDSEVIQSVTETYNLPETKTSFGLVDYSLRLTNGSELPSGFTFDSSSLVLEVNSTTLTGGDVFDLTYHANDDYNSTGNTSFTVTILVNHPINVMLTDFYLKGVNEIALEPGKEIKDIKIHTPTLASPGNHPLTYTLAGDVPDIIGLSIDPSTGILSGTTTASFSPTPYRIRVTDANGDSILSNFLYFVPEAKISSFTDSYINVSCLNDGQVCEIALDTISSFGNFEDVYAVNYANGTALSDEFSFIDANKTLTIDTDGIAKDTNYQLIYSATDIDGDAGTQAINLTVTSYNNPVADTVGALEIIQGQTLNFKLPIAASGFGVLSYEVSNQNGTDVGSYLSFVNNSRTLTINSSSLSAYDELDLRLTVRDGFGGTGSSNFKVTVLLDLPIAHVIGDFYTNLAKNIALEPGKQITDVAFLSISETSPGNLPLSYSIVGAADLGLSINSSTGLVSGELPASFDQTDFQIQITDADGDIDITDVYKLTASSRTPGFASTSGDLLCEFGEENCSYTLPAQSIQGNVYDTITLTLENGSQIPSYMSFFEDNRSLIVDPSSVKELTSFTFNYRIEDIDGSFTQDAIEISIGMYETPSFNAINNISVIQGETDIFKLPSTDINFGGVDYSLQLSNGSSLPATILFDATSRDLTINSTTLTAGDSFELIYIADDNFNGTGNTSFSINVIEDYPVALVLSDFYVNADNEIALHPGKQLNNIEIYSISQDSLGNLPLTFTLEGANDLGLSINASTGLLSGQVASSFTKSSFQIRVTDIDGDTELSSALSFVPEARTPTYSDSAVSLVCLANGEVCDLTLDSAQSLGNLYSLYVLGSSNGSSLPAELSFDSTSLVLSLDTENLADDAAYELTYTVSDADEEVATQSISLAVSSYIAPIAPAIDTLSLILGQTETFTLPLALSGIGELSYQVSLSDGSNLPEGFSYSNDSRELTINSTGFDEAENFTLKYLISDSFDGDASVNFTLAVLEDLSIALESSDVYVNNAGEIALEAGKAISSIALVKVSTEQAGNLPLTYSLVGAEDIGLSINASTGLLSGQVADSFVTTGFQIQVTDADGDSFTTEEQFFISQARTPEFASEIGNLSCAYDDGQCSYTLPAKSVDGNIHDSISLELEGGLELPASLSFTEDNRNLVFNVTGLQVSTSYNLIYSIEDADGSQSSQAIAMTISGYFLPVLSSVDNYSIIQDQSLDFQLPAADNGFGNLTYAVTLANGNAIPAAWSFDASTRNLLVDASGEAADSIYNLSYIISDTNNGSTTVSFSLTVIEDLPIDLLTGDFYVSNDQISLEPGKQITNIQLFSVSSEQPGNLPLTYTLDGAENLGLAINSSTGLLSGQLPTSFAKTNFSITVTDANGDSDSSSELSFIQGSRTPSFNETTLNLECLQGEACSYQLPSKLSDGNIRDTITLLASNDQPLSSEFTFSQDSLSLAFDATSLSVDTTFALVYSIEDADGSSLKQNFTVTVTADSEPTLPAIADINLTVGEFLSVNLGSSESGNGVLTYSLEQSNNSTLPTDFVFNSSSLILSLNTSALSGGDVFELVYTATDTDNDSAMVSFTVTIEGDLLPAIISSGFFANEGAIALAPGASVNSLVLYTLDAAKPGNAPGSFSINGGDSLLGLSLNTQTGELSGTVDNNFVATDFTLVYTDADGDIASSEALSFVPSALTPSFTTVSSNLECLFGNIGCSVTLANATQGNVANTFSVTLENGTELPASFNFVASSRSLSFDPTGWADDTVFSLRYQVEDVDGSSNEQLINASILENINPAFGFVADIEVVDGEQATIALPASIGGTGTITYTLTQSGGNELSSGLVFHADNRSLAINTSSLSQGDNITLNYTATDANNGFGFALFQVVVLEDLMPSISAKDFFVSDDLIALEPGKAINDVALFNADSVGNGPVTFSINDGSSILGLSIDPATGLLSGTVDSDFDTTAFTVSLTDTDGDVASLTQYSFVSESRTPAFNSSANDMICISGESSCSYVLPQVGTTGNLYDTLSLTFANGSALSSNLNFVVADRTLVFDATGLDAGSSFSLNYRVEDADGSIDEQTFALSVVADKLPTLANTTNISVIQGEILTTILPQGTGGNGNHTHSLFLAGGTELPDELTFSAADFSLEVDASSLSAGSIYSLVYEATDTDGDTVSINFNVTILEDSLPSLTVNEFDVDADQIALAPGSAVTNLSLVSVNTIGNGPATFSINGGDSLIGLSIDAITGELSGQVDASFEDTSFTIELTDIDGDVASSAVYEFTANDKAPEFTSAASNLECGFGNTECTYQLSNASVGNIANEFSIRLANASQLPSSLTFNSDNLTLSFDPSGLDVGSSFELIYRVEDIDGSIDEQTITVSITQAIGFTDKALAFILIDQMPVDITLPEASYGFGAITYSIQGDLPNGLSFNANLRKLTGTVSVLGNHSISLVATDSNSDTASLNVNLSVQADQAPEATVESYVSSYGNNAAIAISIEAGDTGNGELSYSFSTISEQGEINSNTGLPAGLYFNSTSNMIEGVTLQPGLYTISITVSDDDNVKLSSDELVLTMTLEVLADIELSGSLASSYEWTAYVASSYTLPEATGGMGALNYSLIEGDSASKQLPSGLSFNTDTLKLEGTTTQTGSYQLTYQVSDSDDNSVSFELNMVVQALPAPVFSSQYDDQEIRINQEISWPALPKANQDPSYAISYQVSSNPTIPSSVTFDSSSREFSGSFAEVNEYTVTYTASNIANVTVSQSFSIEVLAQGVDKALTEDILAHHALAIADSTARQVKSRMALSGKARLALEEGKSRRGRQRIRSLNVEANGLMYSAYGDLYSTSLDQGNEFNWQSGLSITQLGFDVSSKQWFAGVLSETVSSTIDFDHEDTKGSYNLDLGVTTLYGGYKQNKLSYWGATSSGSGGSFDLSLDGSADKQTSSLSYSALLGGATYQLRSDLVIGGDYILDATLTGGGATGSAGRLNAYADWSFAQLTNADGQVWLKPKLNGALRIDTGTASQTGIDVSISSVMNLGTSFYLDAGLRLLVLNLGGDLSETSYWLSAVYQSKDTGFGASLSQRLGNTSFDRNRLLASRLITQVEAKQSEQMRLEGELSYRWLTGNGDWKLFSKGSGSQSAGVFDKDRAMSSLFSDRLGLEWNAGSGLSMSMDYRVSKDATSSFQDQLNGYLDTDDAKLNLKARINLP